MRFNRTPCAPPAEIRQPLTPQTEAEQNTGLVSKLQIGNLAVASAAIEAPFAAVAIVAKQPEIVGIGGLVVACLVGSALYDAHNYYRNGWRPVKPFNKFIKAKELDR